MDEVVVGIVGLIGEALRAIFEWSLEAVVALPWSAGHVRERSAEPSGADQNAHDRPLGSNASA
jgi:hypothetical protein